MNNERRIFSIILAASVFFSLMQMNNRRREKNNSSNPSITISESAESIASNIYTDKDNNIIFLDILNDNNYHSIGEDNQYTLYNNTKVYIKDKDTISKELSFDKSIIVTVLEENDHYAKISLSDGTIGYVEKQLLIKCPKLTNYQYEIINDYKTKITNQLAYLYNNDGSYAGYLDANTICNAVANNGEYTLITLANGDSAFISSQYLTNASKQINGYGLVVNDTILYLDKELQKPEKYIKAKSIVKVIITDNNYACVLNEETGETRYIQLSTLRDDFILIDLEDQKIDCYLDYNLAGSWCTRTGKDTTPTEEGLFDIDAKAADWEFTTFPGSYAKHWIPFNYGQGIHDLVGDDEENYGNELYHHKGSHGCVRVPNEASEFVYDNYREGDMVLVRRK